MSPLRPVRNRGGTLQWAAAILALQVTLLGSTARADDTELFLSNPDGCPIIDYARVFAASAVPVNPFDRTRNLSDVYISVFQPTSTARWVGNLKKYRSEDGVQVGQDGRPVIDPVTGLYARDAFSFWSALPDGDRVSDGGAASRLPIPSARRVFTDLSGNDLSRVDPGTQAVLDALTDVPEAERAAVINWALGRDVQDVDNDDDRTEARLDMGDSLHVQPLTVFYSGTIANPVAAVFLATNDGFLHSFDAKTGVENWAFIPRRLLNPLYPLFLNTEATEKTYGLDGEINLAIVKDDGRPGIDRASGERAILLFGMGRGGDAVFAVDVSDREAPKLLWKISGADSAFADLGQTWSPPVAARVKIGGTIRNVAIFGGGYDPGQDNRTFRQDTRGNAIYMVDLQTGTRLWSVGSKTARGPHDLEMRAMDYSIPAPVKPLDLNGDGVAERFYVGDMGGQLWRFDIVNGQTSASTLVEGGVLASLGGADKPTIANLRRFYRAPDVAPIIQNGKLLLTINIGSGYRGHPLDTNTREAFFSIRDFDVFGVIDRGAYLPPVSVDDLVDITNDADPDLPFASAGWQLRLVRGPGEKVLGESLTFNNTTYFTSFTPRETTSECTGGAGISFLYAISVFDGRAVTNFDSPVGEPLTVADRARTLNTDIPVMDASRFQMESGPTICAGTECLTEGEMERLRLRRSPLKRTYWFQREGP